MMYWYINGEKILPRNTINSETSKQYTGGEILAKFARPGYNRLALKEEVE